MPGTILNTGTMFAVLLALAGCAAAQTGRFANMDANADGRVSRAEFPRPTLFNQFDGNGDGVLTRRELRRAVAQMRGRNAGATPDAQDSGPTSPVTERYGNASASQNLDIYTRSGLRHAPVVIYIHGAAEFNGDKRFVGDKPKLFLGNGFVFVSTNYRLGSEAAHPQNAADVAAAVMWVRANISRYGGDPDRLFLMGHSSGARFAATVATDERLLQAVGGKLSMLRGVVLIDSAQYDVAKAIGSGELSQQETAAYGRAFGRDPKVWQDASAITHVASGKGIPPMFIAAADRGISREVSDDFADRLRAADVKVVRIDAPEKSHTQINRDIGVPGDQVTKAILSFLTATLDGRWRAGRRNLNTA